jgi:hypothetical protein
MQIAETSTMTDAIHIDIMDVFRSEEDPKTGLSEMLKVPSTLNLLACL